MAAGNANSPNEKGSTIPGPAVPVGGSGNKLITIISAVNLLATLGMLAVIFISFKKDSQRSTVEDITTKVTSENSGEATKSKEGEGKSTEAKENEKKRSTNFGKMVTLEQFTVNLSTPGSTSPKFIRVNISLEVPNADAEEEVNAKIPQIRNVIIDLFNSKRPADLATSDGRDYIKEEIKNALNSFLITGKVRGVFFTSFALAG